MSWREPMRKGGPDPDDDDHHQSEVGSMRQFPKIWMQPLAERSIAVMPSINFDEILGFIRTI
jgi:hypothetical protein